MRKIILMIIIGIVFTIGCAKSNSSNFNVKMEAGTKIPVFNLQDTEGNKYTSDKLMGNGKKTVFVMAAEWCPHCKNEMPHLQRFYDENKDKVNVVIVFSNANSSLEAVKTYLEKNGYTLSVYYDNDGSIIKGFNVEGFPTNLKIDGDKIEKVLEPPVDYDKLMMEFSLQN